MVPLPAGGEDQTRPNPARLTILVPFVFVTLVWSSTWLVIRYQIAALPAEWSVTWRFLIAGTVMAAIAAARREAFPRDAKGLAVVAAVGLGQFCVNFNLVYAAEAHIASGLVAVMFALLLLPNALLARITLGQKMGRQLLAGSAVAIAGIGLLILREARATPAGPHETMLGLLFTIGALLGSSVANVTQATQAARRYPMLATVALAMLLGAGVDGAIAWARAGPPTISLAPGYVAGLLYLSLIASALAFPLYYGVLRVIGPAKASYSSVIVPVIAMLLSTVFEGYRWSALSAAGAALACVGLMIALTARRPAR